MRPEGGAFDLFDSVAAQENGSGVPIPGGIVFSFEAHAYVGPRYPDGYLGETEAKLLQPHASFGGTPGVVWDEGAVDGYAHEYVAAFRVAAVVYQVIVTVQDDGRDPTAIQSDADMVMSVLSTITPY
jgi:hypothetical protein